MKPAKEEILKKLIKKEENLYIVKFSELNITKKTLELLEKIDFHNKLTPLDIKQKIEKLFEMYQLNDSFDLKEILNYLEKENLWSMKESIEFQIQYYLKKFYGYHKLYEKLRTSLYNEELIHEKLNNIPSDTWIDLAKTITKKIIKNQNINESLKSKIYKKLQYEGFREEEIEQILKSFSI